MTSRMRLFWILALIIAVQWIYLAFGVKDRSAWVLENILLFLFMGPVVWLYIKGYLSKISLGLLFVFVFLHNIGAHYTYSMVPYEEWAQNMSGLKINEIFGWERNHYDRFLHFLWGCLLYLPLLEIFHIWLKLKGKLLIVFTLLVLMASSTIYEMIEWGAAVVFGDDTGMAFLGTQGDEWDAHKDQLLAFIGSLIAWLISFRYRPKSTYNEADKSQERMVVSY